MFNVLAFAGAVGGVTLREFASVCRCVPARSCCLVTFRTAADVFCLVIDDSSFFFIVEMRCVH